MLLRGSSAAAVPSCLQGAHLTFRDAAKALLFPRLLGVCSFWLPWLLADRCD